MKKLKFNNTLNHKQSDYKTCEIIAIKSDHALWQKLFRAEGSFLPCVMIRISLKIVI